MSGSAGRLEREEPREILDRLDLPLDETHSALQDLGRVNKVLLGHRALRATLLPRLDSLSAGAATILDIAAGSGDGVAAVRRSAERRGARVQVVSSDRKLSHLVIGRRAGDVDGAVVCLAEKLPFRDRAFDWTVSTLFLHHLDTAGKTSVVAEMRRVARREAVIVDLERSRWARWALRVLFPLLGIGRIAYVDGLASIDSSWTLDEWRRFVDGQPTVELRRRFPARVSVVLRGPIEVDEQAPSRVGRRRGGGSEGPPRRPSGVH